MLKQGKEVKLLHSAPFICAFDVPLFLTVAEQMVLDVRELLSLLNFKDADTLYALLTDCPLYFKDSAVRKPKA